MSKISRGRSPAIAVLAAVVLIVIILFLTFRWEAHPARTEDTAEIAALPTAGLRLETTRTPEDVDAPRAAARIDTSFIVVDDAGKAIVGATASLTRLGELTSEFRDSWPWTEEVPWLRATEVLITDQEGRIRFEDREDGERTVWVTAVGYAPWSMRLASRQRIEVPSGQVVLAPAPNLMVRVVDARGDPVSGAHVVQRLSANEATRAALGPTKVENATALLRRTSSDSSGRAELADLGGRQVLDASHGEARSAPWYGAAPAEAELRLENCFTWSGRLVGPEFPTDPAGSRVLLSSVGGGRVMRVGVAPVRSNGTFGPIRSPRTSDEQLEFELEGERWIPNTVARKVAANEERAEVDIPALSGVHFPVRIVEHDGAAVVGARVDWAWSSGTTTQWATRYSRSDGMADFRAAPLGHVLLFVEAAGYMPFRTDLNITGDVQPYYRVELARGGKIAGRVLAQGHPLENFSIVYRGTESFANLGVTDFVDRRDGSFELDGLPLGELSIFAVAPNWPRSEDRRVDATVGATPIVEFDLKPGVVGRGSVHDAVTGEPIAGASAQVWTAEGHMRIREHGRPATSDSSGRFEVSALAVSEVSVIDVRAEGYAQSELMVAPSAAGTLDLGVVTLAKPRALVVRLIVPVDASPTSWTCSIGSGELNESKTFPASGELRFEALPIAGHTVTIAHGPEHTERRFVTVGPDFDASVVFDVASGSHFTVDVGDGAGAAAPPGSWLRVTSYADGYRAVRQSLRSISPGGAVEVVGIHEPRVLLECIDSAGSSLASMARATRDIDGTRVRLRLQSNPVSLRLVDRDDNPLPDVVVGIGSSDSGWAGSATTDSRGSVELSCTNRKIDVVVEWPPNGGGVIRNVAMGDEPATIIADLRAVVGVRLLDGVEPVVGASIWIEDGMGLGAVFPSLVTDEKGEARGTRYLEQTFRGSVRTPGIWPVEIEIPARIPERLQEFQVRRRGSVVLHAKRDGLALRDARISVSSLEFAEPLSKWIASGAVVVSSADLTTNERGDLRIDGLPRGPYRWSTFIEGGAEIGGRFDVLPAKRVDVDLVVP